jgi:hypothetical protein
VLAGTVIVIGVSSGQKHDDWSFDATASFNWIKFRSTTEYLARRADVQTAHVNPLTHYLLFGIHEGRSPFADGV